MNLVEIIQKNLGYTPIKKIDPNTAEPKDKLLAFESASLPQAGVPVIVLGLMNYMAGDLGNEKVPNIETLDELFGENLDEIITRVATYSGNTIEHTKHELNFIAKEALRVTREKIKENTGGFKDFVVVQKRDAMLYLPESLHAGVLLGDSRIDDKTNKMEGPLSNVMHNIEKRFS